MLSQGKTNKQTNEKTQVAHACNLRAGEAERRILGLTDHNLAELVRSSFSERHYFKKRNKMER